MSINYDILKILTHLELPEIYLILYIFFSTPLKTLYQKYQN
jgi:hypothetical protein